MAADDEEARRRAAMSAIAAERQAWESEQQREAAPGSGGDGGPAPGRGGVNRGLVAILVGSAVAVVLVAVLLLAGGGGDDDSVATEDRAGEAAGAVDDTEGATPTTAAADDADATTTTTAAPMADMADMAATTLPDPLPGPPLDLTVADAQVLAPQILEYRQWLLANPDEALIGAIAMPDSPAFRRMVFEVGGLAAAAQRIEYDDYHYEIEEVHRMGEGIGFHLHEDFDGRRVYDGSGALVRTEPGGRQINSHIMLWPQPDGRWLMGIYEPGTMAEGMNHEEWLRELGAEGGMEDMSGM